MSRRSRRAARAGIATPAPRMPLLPAAVGLSAIALLAAGGGGRGVFRLGTGKLDLDPLAGEIERAGGALVGAKGEVDDLRIEQVVADEEALPAVDRPLLGAR